VKDQIAGALQNSQRILIITHVYPDGDCIGSSLALALGLKSIGKDVMIVDDHAVPPVYAFLPSSSEIRFPDDVGGVFDLVVAIDVSDTGRLGNASLAFFTAELLLPPIITTLTPVPTWIMDCSEFISILTGKKVINKRIRKSVKLPHSWVIKHVAKQYYSTTLLFWIQFYSGLPRDLLYRQGDSILRPQLYC
jgi:hypothetical protein